MATILQEAGHQVAQAEAGAGAARLLAETPFDLLICDVNLPGDNGMDLLRRARAEGFDGVGIVVTAYGTIRLAVEAMRQGADDFLQKPLKMEELPVQVGKWLRQRHVARRLELYERVEQGRQA